MRTRDVGDGNVAGLLEDWCEALLRLQIRDTGDPRLDGAILCPACGRIHGRCGDAMHPFLHMARVSGQRKWIEAAKGLFSWSERVVSQENGSMLNDIDSTWDGITVFYADTLCKCLHVYGSELDECTRDAWRERLRRAADYLVGYRELNENNVNYTIGNALALWECGEVLQQESYRAAARSYMELVYDSFAESGILYGEGVPRSCVTKAGCRPVDIGYNVEESLPMLLRYGRLAHDERALELARCSMRAHLDFLLPDGGWDNSFGTRKFKWTYWGSRTTDGAVAALLELSERPDDEFALAAKLQLELLASCTHDGLLCGGPQYVAAGQPACVHHTFEHAKMLAEVLDRGPDRKLPGHDAADGAALPRVPRLARQGFRLYPELRTWVGSFGEATATVTAYDFEYLPGGHTSGGSISLLSHASHGPLLCASVGEYVRRERNNMQVPYRVRHECLTLRMELRQDGTVFSSMYEDAPQVAVEGNAVEVSGHLKDAHHAVRDGAPQAYRLRYVFAPEGLELAAELPQGATLIVPLVSEQGEHVMQGAGEGGTAIVRIDKATGSVALAARTGKPTLPYGEERIFNLVPGLQALRVDVAPCDGRVHLSLSW